MHLKRVIPCLDVKEGRVVKGVNFVGLRDAGDPVELAARYDAEGADEVVFLDITATSDARDTVVDLARPRRRRAVHPVHDRRRHPLRRRCAGRARRGRRQGEREQRRREGPGADRPPRRGVRRAVRRPGDRRPPARGRRGRGALLGGVRRRRPHADRDRRHPMGHRRRTPRRWRDPAHEHGPRRHEGRLRPRARATRERRGARARDRLRRRRHARAPRRRAAGRR